MNPRFSDQTIGEDEPNAISPDALKAFEGLGVAAGRVFDYALPHWPPRSVREHLSAVCTPLVPAARRATLVMGAALLCGGLGVAIDPHHSAGIFMGLGGAMIASVIPLPPWKRRGILDI